MPKNPDQEKSPTLFDDVSATVDKPKTTTTKKRKTTSSPDAADSDKKQEHTEEKKKESKKPKETNKKDSGVADGALEELKKVTDTGADTNTVSEVLEKEPILPPPANLDFLVHIPYAHAFKNLVEICCHVLKDLNISLKAEDSFSGMYINCMDPSNTCMVIARFACKAQVRGKQHFCVTMSTLNTCLKHVNARNCIKLYRTVGAADVIMIVSDPGDSSQFQKFVFKTLDRDPEEDVLDKFTSDYTIEIELNEFRSLVKTAKDINAEELSFKIYEPKKAGPLRSSYFVISVAGNDVDCTKVYHSLTEWNNSNDSVVIKTVEHGPQSSSSGTPELPDLSQLKVCLDENFGIKYLTNFMANMKHNTLTMRLSSSGEPMLLSHPIGSESQVSFVLAPRQKDAQEDDGVNVGDVPSAPTSSSNENMDADE